MRNENRDTLLHDVFLSHNSKDQSAVRALATILTKRGIKVWLDEDQLIPGRSWQPLMEEGIKQSRTGAVLVGADGLGPWEDEEMQAFLNLAVRQKKFVIPVLLPGAPKKPDLPLSLSNRTWVDLRDGFRKKDVDKLIWGITGKKWNDASRVADVSGYEEYLFEDHPPYTPNYNEDHFSELLSKYSEYLRAGLRQSLLEEIILSAWEALVNCPPYFASKLMSQVGEIQPTIARLIIPLCKVSINNPNNPIRSTELADFLTLLRDNDHFPISDETRVRRILIARIIRFVLYNQHSQSDLVKSTEFRQEFERLAYEEDVFWGEFFTDLYLRYSCDYIVLDENLLSIVKSRYDRNMKDAIGPLSQLCPLILFPTETVEQHQKDEFTLIINRIAAGCQTLMECRWCISALLRIIPLYSCSEEELDYTHELKQLMERFGAAIRSKYPQIRFVYLKTLLGRFMRIKDPQLIKGFEDGFLMWFGECGNNPLLSQLCHLQLEYASCLYVCCCFLEAEEIHQLMFGALIANRIKLLNHKLFHNQLLVSTRSIQVNPTLNSKAELFRWLLAYTSTLWRVYAIDIIRENHLRLLQFKASTRVYQNQSLFCRPTLTSLIQHDNSICEFPSSFYAKSMGVLTFIQRNKNIDLIKNYLKQAMRADDYTFMRNAKHIAHCLYSCYYYGESKYRKEVEEMAELFANRTAIGISEIPKIHWAYYVGLKYNARPIEMQFLEDLWNQSKELDAVARQLSFRIEEDAGARFPDIILSVSKVYSALGSYFACVLLAEKLMISPELWNLFGTTVYDNAQNDDAAACEMAAHFYYFAMCFARTRKDDDQKYFYNWIRSKGLAYTISKLNPDIDYLKEVASYIRKPSAKFFAYRGECVRAYLDLLNDHWDEISLETREFIQERLSQVEWLKKLIKRADLRVLLTSLFPSE